MKRIAGDAIDLGTKRPGRTREGAASIQPFPIRLRLKNSNPNLSHGDSAEDHEMELLLQGPEDELPEKHDDAVSEPAAVRLWLRLLTCSMTIEKRVRRRLADEFDTTLPRFDVLAALDRRPDGMTMGELSQALLVSSGNLTALVRQLERQEYLKMARDPEDRRSWLVNISASGRKHFRRVATEHHHWIAGMFAGMAADRSEQLYDLLAELKKSLAADTKART